MRAQSAIGIWAAFVAVVSAIPATNPTPTAITQAAAGDPINNDFNTPFKLPGTETVLWLSQGRKAAVLPLRILLSRAQLDLNSLIAQYGPQGIPGRIRGAPQYAYLTRTPMGVEGYFFVGAVSQGKLTYGLANETLTALRLYMTEKGQSEQIVFEVESFKQRVAFGGVSVGPQAALLEALSNDTALASDRTSLAGIVNMELRLQCTFARPLHPAIVSYLLSDAEEEVREKIKSEGAGGRLPGVAGEWEKDGHRGCLFTIDGIVPTHLTWGTTKAAVAAMKLLLVGGPPERIPREATCTMILGPDVVGVTSVKMKELDVAQR